jgi:hypothetical protein
MRAERVRSSICHSAQWSMLSGSRAALRMNHTVLERGRALLREHAPTVYSGVASGVVAATSAAAAGLAAYGGATPAGRLLAGVAGLPLGVWYAGRVARPLVSHLVNAHAVRLPRLASDGTVPRAWRTLVVIPAIVATPERARELLVRLAWLAREHDDPNLRFALLADFADAPSRFTTADAAILAEEERLVERINADLRREDGDRVFVLHRARTWNVADRTWIGWERKRGKLLELNRLLLGRTDTSYRWTFGAFARQLDQGTFPYVYTLDEANWVPRGEVLSLLRVAAHPENRAQFDGDGRLVRGYAIFQPAVVPASPSARAGGEVVMLSPLAAGQHLGTTWFHFDVLGVGLFKGKGLLDVRACHALLENVFPPHAVLQHDPMEGFVARTAEVHDAFVLEAVAPGYLAQVRRGHRWLRGSFQMLPWVLPRVRGSDDTRRANPLRPIHRLLILELALAELGRPASFLLLVAGWLALHAHGTAWTVLVFPPLALLLAQLLGTALAAVASMTGRALHPTPRVAGPPPALRPLMGEAFAAVFSLALLPYEAIVVMDALCRATWRMLASRRHLLDWPSVSRVHAATRLRQRREYVRTLWACCASGALTLASVAASQPAHLPLALPFAVAWLCAPSLAAWLDGTLLGQDTQGSVDATDAVGEELGLDSALA